MLKSKLDKGLLTPKQTLAKGTSGTSINAHLKSLIQNNHPLKTTKKRKSMHRKHKDEPPKQNGIIFIWPQKEKLYLNEHVKSFAYFLAYGLYWLHVTRILPSGTDLALKEPPWDDPIPQSIPKPVVRNNIIEPDWDSLSLQKGLPQKGL